MIIWIDGANGIGKSNVAEKLTERLSNINAEFVESDKYWDELIEDNPVICFQGFFPYCNRTFLVTLRSVLDEKIERFGKTPVVSMSLTDKLCQEELLNYFQNKGIAMRHIILEASQDVIKSRIENDPIRNMELQKQQISNLNFQIQYLNKKYPDAIRISTENKEINKIIVEIMRFI